MPEDERPGRRRRGGSGLSILFVGALLVAGAWFGGKYARVLFHLGGGQPAASSSAPAGTPAVTPAEPPPGPEPAKKNEAVTARDGGPRARAAAAEPSTPRPRADAPAAREADKRRRAAGGERPVDFVGRDIANLKDKMAPDPSLLPAPAPAKPEEPAPAPAPTPPPASSENQ